MVVAALGTLFPFIDGAAAAFGSDAVFGGEVLGQKAVLFGPVAEKREAAFVGHGETLRLRCVITKGATAILHHCVCERSWKPTFRSHRCSIES